MTNGARKPKSPRKPKPPAKPKSPPKPAHLGWVIDGRQQNQRATLRLYKLFVDRKLKGVRNEAQQLAAVAFSLWRAVFLADRTGKMDAKEADAKCFLAKMLTDNSISFAQDRESREWTFNYYMEDAFFRLQELSKKWTPIAKGGLIPGDRTAKNRWTRLEVAFEKALTTLEQKIKSKNKKQISN